MSASRNDKDSNTIFHMGSVGVASLTIVGALMGFIYLAKRDPAAANLSWFDVICRAAGFFYTPSPPYVASENVGSKVSWTVSTLKQSVKGDNDIGKTLVERCAVCHGTELSTSVNVAPRLHGLDARSIYKQMVDYRDNRRVSPVMNEIAAGLSDKDISDLSAYYASHPASPVKEGKTNGNVSKLVNVGDPGRNIVPCASCHGPAAYKNAAPNLFGLPPDYFKTQLEDFAKGERKNDISRQMRYIARGLTAQEIDDLTTYYTKGN